ncbi:hypothetical protein ES703_122004 [subsurface metagenome]
MKRTRYLSLLIALMIGIVVGAEPTGRVVRITDGDTITLRLEGRRERVRLSGIDAPERAQPFGERARQHIASLCFQRLVTLSDTSRDVYGRLLAVVTTDSVNVNRAMVRDGFAWHYHEYSSDATLAQLHSEARAAKCGLWSDADPVAPWDFRRGAYEASQPDSQTAGITVYVTRTGRKYHRSGCRYLRRSKIAISLEDAKSQGYTPCSICKPPR